jgi:hypothetical protein
MSSRPRRSCTLPVAAPVLSRLLEETYELSDSELFARFQGVTKYFKEDVDALANFWLSNTDSYDLTNREHLLLLTRVLNSVGCKHALAVEFLNTLTKKQVRSVGLQRVETDSSVFYRARVGALADSKEDHDYDDYCKAREFSREYTHS